MDVVGNLMVRALYVYEWKDGSVYVGLTHDYQERNIEHMKTDRYRNKTEEFGPPEWIKMNEWMEAKEAAKKECELIKRYLDEGRDVLNKNAGGQLGGNSLYWTKERCLEKSKKFVKKSDFRENEPGAYNSASRKGWMEECCLHMEQKRKNNYWSKERCLEEVKKHKTIKELTKMEIGCHASIYKNGWQEELFAHYEDYRPRKRSKQIRI